MAIVDRYGPAINADFRSLFGVRLLDFFTGAETWGEFWRLLGQLGSDSRYVKAQLDDPEVARAIAQREKEEDPAWHPQAADWTLMHDLMASILDRVTEMVVITGRGLPSNGTRQFPPPFSRPDTELGRQRQQVAAETIQRYDDKILGEVERAKERWRAQQAEGEGS